MNPQAASAVRWATIGVDENHESEDDGKAALEIERARKERPLNESFYKSVPSPLVKEVWDGLARSKPYAQKNE